MSDKLTRQEVEAWREQEAALHKRLRELRAERDALDLKDAAGAVRRLGQIGREVEDTQAVLVQVNAKIREAGSRLADDERRERAQALERVAKPAQDVARLDVVSLAASLHEALAALAEADRAAVRLGGSSTNGMSGLREGLSKTLSRWAGWGWVEHLPGEKYIVKG